MAPIEGGTKVGISSLPRLNYHLLYYFWTYLSFGTYRNAKFDNLSVPFIKTPVGRGTFSDGPPLSEVYQFLATNIAYGVLEKPSIAQLWPSNEPESRRKLLNDLKTSIFGTSNSSPLYGTLGRFMDYPSCKKWLPKYKSCKPNEQNSVLLPNSLQKTTLQIEGRVRPFTGKFTQVVVEDEHIDMLHIITHAAQTGLNRYKIPGELMM